MNKRSFFITLFISTTLYLGVSAPFGIQEEDICSWQRGDTKCNLDEDCCLGSECDSFGYCVRSR